MRGTDWLGQGLSRLVIPNKPNRLCLQDACKTSKIQLKNTHIHTKLVSTDLTEP